MLLALDRTERRATLSAARLRRMERRAARAASAARRADAHRKIRLGGLVVRAQLPALAGDDPAVILGALLDVAARLRDDPGGDAAARWRRLGIAALGEGKG